MKVSFNQLVDTIELMILPPYSSSVRGGYGGGIATIYEKNQLTAVCGGGGGAVVNRCRW